MLIAAPLALVFSLGIIRSHPEQIRPGVWAGNRVESLPLPTTGYKVYIVGEHHGLTENADFQLAYLRMLVDRTHLRDVALEEKSLYETDAQSYIDGDAKPLPAALCLRASLLRGLRLLNSKLEPSKHVRIHLIDVDSPASAIHEHLLLLSKSIPHSDSVAVPRPADLKDHGEETVRRLEALVSDQQVHSELRTVGFAIRALRDGFEVGTGPAKGSAYLEEREEAMTENLAELIRRSGSGGVLVVCGFDHASRRERKDGGPNRNQPFWPMAARLESSGLRTFTIVTFPLSGETFWRGTATQLPWGAADGHLSTGEKLSEVILSAPSANFFYIDALKEHAQIPSEDVSHYGPDAFMLFPVAHPMLDECISVETH